MNCQFFFARHARVCVQSCLPKKRCQQTLRKYERVSICIATANSVDSKSRQGALSQQVGRKRGSHQQSSLLGVPTTLFFETSQPLFFIFSKQRGAEASSIANKQHSTLRCLMTSRGRSWFFQPAQNASCNINAIKDMYHDARSKDMLSDVESTLSL